MAYIPLFSSSYGQDLDQDFDSDFEYSDQDYYSDSDDDDVPAYLAPIASDDIFDFAAFAKNLKPVKVLSEKEKLDVIKKGKELLEDFNPIEGKIIRPAPLPEKLLDKFNDYNEILEMDHNFKNRDWTNVVLDRYKLKIVEWINKSKIKYSLKDNNCEAFLKREIDTMLKKFKDKKSLSVKESVELMSQDMQSFRELFLTGLNKFKKFKLAINEVPRDLKMSVSDDIKQILEYDDKQFCVKLSIIQVVKFVYLPSGSGKTTLASTSPDFYDVDQLIREHFDSFKTFRKFIKERKDLHVNMNQWFKYTISKLSRDKIMNRILLMNHPNQVPNAYKIRSNELIIFPTLFNFRTRFFSENLYSLLAVENYVKVFLDFSKYKKFIFFYFEKNHVFKHDLKKSKKVEFRKNKRKTEKVFSY